MIPDGSTNTCPLKSNPERKPRVEAAPRMHRAMVLNLVAALPQSNSLELLKSKDIGVYSTRGGENHGSRGRDGGGSLLVADICFSLAATLNLIVQGVDSQA